MARRKISRSLMRAVALPTIAALLLLASIVGAVLHFSTSRSDQLALARQENLIKLAVGEAQTTIARDQEASTYWDDAVLRTRQRPLDLQWIDNNLGIWFYTYYKHDEAYLLDPSDRPIYAMQTGDRAQPTSFSRISRQALRLTAALRKQLLNGYVAPAGSPGQTLGASSVTSIGGRPALISVQPLVSETGNIAQPPGTEYLHITDRY